MQHTANPPQAPQPAERHHPGHERDDESQGAIEPSRLRAMLEQREEAIARFRQLKNRLLRR